MKKILFFCLLSSILVIPSVAKAEDGLNPNLESKNETVYISNLGPEENHFEEIEPSGINEKMEISETQFLEIDSNFTEGLEVLVENSGNKSARAMTYMKTITLTRNSPNFPATTTYSEYHNGMKRWYAGTLNFQSSRAQNGKYVATYTGLLIMTNW